MAKMVIEVPEEFAEVGKAMAEHLGVRLPEINIVDFFHSGYLPETLINFLALLGWNPGDDREKMSSPSPEADSSANDNSIDSPAPGENDLPLPDPETSNDSALASEIDENARMTGQPGESIAEVSGSTSTEWKASSRLPVSAASTAMPCALRLDWFSAAQTGGRSPT